MGTRLYSKHLCPAGHWSLWGTPPWVSGTSPASGQKPWEGQRGHGHCPCVQVEGPSRGQVLWAALDRPGLSRGGRRAWSSQAQKQVCIRLLPPRVRGREAQAAVLKASPGRGLSPDPVEEEGLVARPRPGAGPVRLECRAWGESGSREGREALGLCSGRDQRPGPSRLPAACGTGLRNEPAERDRRRQARWSLATLPALPTLLGAGGPGPGGGGAHPPPPHPPTPAPATVGSLWPIPSSASGVSHEPGDTRAQGLGGAHW